MTEESASANDRLEQITTASGARRIAFSQLGALDGYPAIYAHGFPSSRREAWLIDAAARELGIRIISVDRPGYGDSDPAPNNEIADWPNDVAAVANALALERFALIGVSGGAPYVLACASRLSQPADDPLKGRVSHCLLICPLGPIFHDHLLDQMHWAARTNLSIGKHSAWLSDLVFGGPTPTLLERWPALIENTRSLAAPTTDRRVLADRKTIAILNGTIADAMRNGAVGARRDLRLYTHEWGFELDAIRFPVRIWHGQSDGTVPVDHARWYAEHIPSVELTELPNEGHYSVPICHSRQILAELLEPASEPPSDSSDAAATS